MRVLAHIFFRKPIKIFFNEQAISKERGNFKNEKILKKHHEDKGMSRFPPKHVGQIIYKKVL